MARSHRPILLVVGAVALIALCYAISPPIAQDPRYHVFADRRTLFGIPNFWNVASNLPFFLVALYGARVLRGATFQGAWERIAYGVLLAGTAAVGLGSIYYHLHPNDARLFWDRLPMTVVFTSIVASVIGDRVGGRAGKALLGPLLLFGAASVVYWRLSGDLRLYAIVQFGSAVAVPLLLLLFPPRYSGAPWLWAAVALYGAAKIAELVDGHPWKHVAAAAALLCYVISVQRRRPIAQMALTADGVLEGVTQ